MVPRAMISPVRQENLDRLNVGVVRCNHKWGPHIMVIVVPVGPVNIMLSAESETKDETLRRVVCVMQREFLLFQVICCLA